MSTLQKIIIAVFVLFSTQLYAAYKDSNDVKIKLISVHSSNGRILVQTNPRHNVSGLDCISDYWLVLDKNEASYQASLSLLLSAQATQRDVIVRADDSSGQHFCRLSRIVTKGP